MVMRLWQEDEEDDGEDLMAVDLSEGERIPHGALLAGEQVRPACGVEGLCTHLAGISDRRIQLIVHQRKYAHIHAASGGGVCPVRSASRRHVLRRLHDVRLM